MNGLIGFRDQEDGPESLSEGWLLRPGGFLNPNMSAALSLIWLFIALESKLDNCYWLKSVCIAIGVFIAAITQSRAALLFLFIYSAYKAYEGGIKGIKYYLILIVCGLSLFMFFNQSGMLEDLYNANMVRAQGDSSSEERYLVLQGALTTFAGSPITGSGIRAMYRFFGLGTHDEIIEWLVNFGLAGFLVMLLIFFKFYYVNSFKYLCLCILPTFLFSHNFFETTAFQVALAYAFYLMKRGAQEKTGTLAAWNAPPRAAMEDTATVSNTN